MLLAMIGHTLQATVLALATGFLCTLKLGHICIGCGSQHPLEALEGQVLKAVVGNKHFINLKSMHAIRKCRQHILQALPSLGVYHYTRL